MKKVHGFAREDELRNFFTSNNQWQSRFVLLSDNSTTSSAKKICRNSTNPSFEKSWCCQRSFDIPEMSQDGTGSVARAEQTPGVPCMDPSEWNCKAVPKEGDVTITLGQGDLLRPHQEIFQSKPWHAWRTMKPRCPPEPGKTSLNIFKTWKQKEFRHNSQEVLLDTQHQLCSPLSICFPLGRWIASPTSADGNFWCHCANLEL